MTGARLLVVALIAVAAAILVVRNAFVAAYVERDPGRAAGVWPGHPAVMFRTGLDRIGEEAAAGRAIPPAMIDPLLGASRAAPLAPEPFLVRGVQLRVAGDETAAGRAFAEAKRRDPRSIPARFFLADHYLRSDAIDRGLEEIATLSRLVPGSAARLAPVLAGYAETPGAAPQVKTMLRSHPELEPALLQHLAADARNAELVMSLASDRGGDADARRGWQTQLVNSLVASGEYAKAYAMWADFMGVRAPFETRPLLFDPQFERRAALPPFGWTLVSSAGGLVEPTEGGLHVIYYGRADAALATQLLLLAPGTYNLAMTVSKGGDGASSLAWTATCLASKQVIVTLDLAKVATMKNYRFEVPGTGCAGQQLTLRGTPPEYPQTVDLTLSGLSLSRGGGQ